MKMKKQIIQRLHKNFEEFAQKQGKLTYWYARDLQELLEYTKWENFEKTIIRAMQSCKTSSEIKENHFLELRKMVQIGSSSGREIKDYMLTRYACYLIAQNGDPQKDSIAFAQSYFAIQTRKQELLEERIHLVERIQARAKLSETEKQLSDTLYEHGIDDKGFAIVRSSGDEALFGGHNTEAMKRKLKVPKNKPLADFLPTVTLKAKEFAAAITDFNVRKEDLEGLKPITTEHVKNNRDVRAVLEKSDIKPEDLPSEEDIKKLQRQVQAQNKKLLKGEGSFREDFT